MFSCFPWKENSPSGFPPSEVIREYLIRLGCLLETRSPNTYDCILPSPEWMFAHAGVATVLRRIVYLISAFHAII